MLILHFKIVILAAGAARLASAHTAFTNFFVNGVDQGDGTAVRLSDNIPQATFPLGSVTSPDMACGESALCLAFPVECLCSLMVYQREVHIMFHQLTIVRKLRVPS